MKSKWETVSGFPELYSQLGEELLSFITTQQFLTDPALLTAGPAELATQTGIVSFTSELVDIVTQFVATETNMAPSDRAKFMVELHSALASVTGTASEATNTSSEATKTSSEATNTAPEATNTASEAMNIAVTMPGSAAGLACMDLLSVSCAVAALIAAVAVAL